MDNVTDTVAVPGIREAKAALDECDRAIAAFRKKNMAVVNGRAVYASPTVTGRPALELELRGLLRERDRAWRRHQEAMKQYAEIKMRGVPV